MYFLRIFFEIEKSVIVPKTTSAKKRNVIGESGTEKG